MRNLFILCLLIGLVGGVYAAPPATPDLTQKITGADVPVPLGELVDLSVTPLKDVPNLEKSSYAWRVYDFDSQSGEWKIKRVRTSGDGVFFGAGIISKKLKVFCIATHLFIEREGDKIKSASTKTVILETDIVVGDKPEPNPGPGPKPPKPNPSPSFPEGQFGLAKWAYENSSLVKDDGARLSGALALSKSFGSIASAIAANAIKTPEDALKKAVASNDAALDKDGIKRAAWGDFGKALQEKLYGLYKDKKLNTVKDYQTAFTEIKEGLEAVK